MSMSISEAVRLRDLERRVAELEARQPGETSPFPPLPLKQRNAARQADGECLRQAIASVLAAHQGDREMTRKEVLRALERMDIGRSKLPSLSTVGWHIREIRKEQPVNVNAAH